MRNTPSSAIFEFSLTISQICLLYPMIMRATRVVFVRCRMAGFHSISCSRSPKCHSSAALRHSCLDARYLTYKISRSPGNRK